MSASIVLLTDLGHRDGYVGMLKGIIQGISTDTRVIDLSHELFPHPIRAARFILWNSYQLFPEGTIFLCVVDASEGEGRHLIALHTEKHIFIAPDNGTLDFVMAEQRVKHLLRIETPRVMRPTQSPTFQGRDILAPAAAHIAAGFPFTMLGPMHPYSLPESPFITFEGEEVHPRVIYVDQFGNLITNLKLKELPAGLRVRIYKRYIPLGKTYADGEKDEPIALIGSHGLLEIAYRNIEANHQLLMKAGDQITVDMGER